MRILFHLGGVALFVGLFWLGKRMVHDRAKWADALAEMPVADRRVCNFFLYSGEIFQAVAFVGALLEFVAVLILMNGALIDQLMMTSV